MDHRTDGKYRRRIFISYRRQGGIDTARWLYDHLTARGYQVFMDLEKLGSGQFKQALYREIYNCDVFLLVLTEGSLKRCRKPSDWVRREIVYALQCGRTVIPVMKEGFVWPRRLPEDIAAIQSYQGIEINYSFFGSFLDKLDDYISQSPVAPKKARPPEPQQTRQLPFKYIAAALALLAVVFSLMFGSSLASRPVPTEPSDSSSETGGFVQEEPETQEESGNTVTNLCDGGIVVRSGGNATRLTSKDVFWVNYVRNSYGAYDTRYEYDAAQRYIQWHWEEDDVTYRRHVWKDIDCEYLYVTSRWLYCALVTDGSCTLYRARNDLEEHMVGNLEPIAENVLAENRVAIQDGCVYYWVSGEGLRRCRTDGSENILLYDNGGRSVDRYATFWICDGLLYFYAPSYGVYAVDTQTGDLTDVLDTAGLGGRITNAVGSEGKIYLATAHKTEDGSAAPARLWECNQDGTEAELIYTMSNADQRILRMNIDGRTLYLQMAENGNSGLYSIIPDTHRLELVTGYSG